MISGSLAERLRVLRAQRGMTLVEAAEQAGVGRDTLSDLERGRRHPVMPTLAKIAQGYGVPVEELLEEPVGAGKDKAPKEAGLDKQLTEELEDEKEQRIVSIHPSTLENEIKFIRSLKEQREAEIEEVKQGAVPRAHWGFHLEADNKYLEIIYQVGGFFAFVEEVVSGRRMTDFSVQRLCHEFSRHFSDFVKLVDEAKALDHERQSDTHVEGVKGSAEIEAWLHKQSTES
jgi:transcriptional regulator with XRE-family HTH domain